MRRKYITGKLHRIQDDMYDTLYFEVDREFAVYTNLGEILVNGIPVEQISRNLLHLRSGTKVKLLISSIPQKYDVHEILRRGSYA